MPDNPTIDQQAINALLELSTDSGTEFLRELIEIYLQDSPLRLAELDEALSKNDLPGLTRAAHTIKGSSSNFGATRLTKIAHDIEMLGKAGSVSEVAPLISNLKAEYELVAQALKEIAKTA